MSSTPDPETPVGSREDRSSPAARRLFHRFETFAAQHSPATALAVGVALVAVIWGADVLTGPRLAPSIFYLIPVGLVTWRLGRGMGVTIAVVSSLAWIGAELIGHVYPLASPIAFWNTVARFGVLVVVVVLLDTVHDSLERERDLAAHEAAAAEHLREINDLKDTLLHAVSHDLKGPITAILGSAQSLARRRQLRLTGEEEYALIDGIVASGIKLDRLVDDLLDFERLDRGVIEPVRAPTDLGAMARRLVAEADYLAQHPARVIAAPIEVSVDAAKVERILENLLRNAARHTPPGTPVVIRVEQRESGVLLSVEDEGPGIPDELKDVVFQPFRQGRTARASQSGAGIGLSLVAKFAGLHAGSAWVEDRPGGGTTFRVYLPGDVRPVPPTPERAEAASPTPGVEPRGPHPSPVVR